MSRFKFPHMEEPSLRVRARRYFLTIFCCFFIVFGIVVITVSAVLVSRRPVECDFLGDFYGGVYLLLAAGCATGFISLLACLQTQRGLAFGGFLLCVCHVIVLILMFQIFAAIASHILYVRTLDGQLTSMMDARWKSYHTGEKSCVDRLQRDFECCGVVNDTEWVFLSEGGVVGGVSPYPSSCLCAAAGGETCITRNGTFNNISYLVHVHGRLCHDAVLGYLFDKSLVPRVLGPVLSVVEFVLLLVAIFVLRHINNHTMVGAYVVGVAREEGAPAAASEPGPVDLQERRAVPLCGPWVPEDSLSLSRDETVMHI